MNYTKCRLAVLSAAMSLCLYCPESISGAKRMHGVESDGFTLNIVPGEDGYGIELRHGGDVISRQPEPAVIVVRGSDVPHSEQTYRQPYDTVWVDSGLLMASSMITTSNGSRVIIKDDYRILTGGVFGMGRSVSVAAVDGADAGFASVYSLESASGLRDIDSYEYFIPSILYRNTADVRADAVAADLDVDRMYVKETRSGLPLAMLREKSRGLSATLMHANPEVSVGQYAGGGSKGEINDSLRYGSIGYSRSSAMSVDFRYPSAEGPRTYEPMRGRKRGEPVWSDRYHSMRPGNGHSYTLAIIPGKDDTYNRAMTRTFTTAYTVENPPVAKMDMDSVYKQNIDLFKSEYRSFGIDGGMRSAGLPWSLDLPDGKNTEGVSFQMGFVGQQIAVGYHLYRYGLDHNEADTKEKGKSMVDFWVSDIIMGDYFPTVWWDPSDNATAGQRRNYPTFLRCMVDGMEGLLDACRIAEAYGEPHREWRDALCRVAYNLVDRQNPDGSFYRAYEPDGSVAKAWDRNTQADSKLNTPVAVRFLVKMFESTGDERFKQAAIRAAQFAYDELYQKRGKYVGGTPDNPNTVDKEAAIFALYAFNAVHELTGDEKYLEAAEHAAMCAMSWTYCYDFAIPNRDGKDASQNPFADGGTLGFSVIATGHSAADNFIAYTFYEMFKLYVKTGNETYLGMARFLQNNTKLNTDYDGRMGYKYRAFMPEATNIADLAFRSVSLWLPWASIANIEPIVNLEEAFGCNDLFKIEGRLPELRSRMRVYGVGGRPMKR